MIGELRAQLQLRAASAAAARQTMPAAGASRGSISLVKNQAFPPFLFLRDVRRHPGLVYIPSLQDLSRLKVINFSQFSADSFYRKCRARPVPKQPWLLRSRPVGISFFVGVWEFLRGVSEFRFVSCAPGAGRPDAGKLSTGY